MFRIVFFGIMLAVPLLVLGCGGDDKNEGPNEVRGVPSPTAEEEGWPENEGFGGVPPLTDYGRPGWVGKWDDRGVPITAIDPDTPIPVCGQTVRLEAVATSPDTLCGAFGLLPDPPPYNYEFLCNENVDSLKKLCRHLCDAIDPACANWQLQPHVYEEWGCINRPLASLPDRMCRTVEGCRCTTELG